MEDPKLPKQLTEASPLDEFAATGNLYVDPSYTAEGTPATSPITGEALVFGENTLTNLTANNNTSPATNPADEHAIFVSNLKRGTARGAGHDFFFSYNRTGKALSDVYIINSEGGDFSASPRVADNYVADSDGTLSVYIENSNFGGNLMGFGSQTKNTQKFTGNYEFTFKNSRAQWFCITYGTGYGLGETNANNNRYGTLVGNMDLVVDGSTITNNGAVIRGAILPGAGDEKAYLRAYIKNSLFQGEFGIIQNGVEGGSDQYKSNADFDITVEGSTFTNVFLMFPNVSTNTQVRDGKLTITGDVNFKVTNTRFSGLNMGAGLGGTGWNRTGWIKGDIKFDISGSSNSSRTFVHKGFVGESSAPKVVEGTLSNSIFGDFTGYDTRENNYIYAATTIKIVESTIGNFTLYNTINSGGTVTATADRVFGAQTLEVTGSSAGNVAGNGPGANQSGATFDLVFHASDTVSAVGAISAWNTMTVDAGAKVRANSITLMGENSVLNIAVGSALNTADLKSIATINVTGDLPTGDTIVVSGLTIAALEEGTKVMVGETELSYGLFGGQYSITAKGDLVIHNGTTYLVNREYTDGVETDLGPIGYTTIKKAQDAIDDPTAISITVYGEDPENPGNTLNENVITKNYAITFTSNEENRIEFSNKDILIGDTSAVDSVNLNIAYTDNINAISFGDITNKALVSVDNSSIAELNLTAATAGDSELSFTNNVIENVKLADQAGFKGSLVIADSTITNVYGGASGLDVDMTGDNIIENVFAEYNASSIKLGSSQVQKFVAGYSDAKSVSTFEYEGAVNAIELYVGGDEAKNTIGTLKAKITGGSVNTLHLGGANDTITGNAEITFDGGEFDNVAFGDIGGKADITLSGGHFVNGFEVYNVAGKANVTLAGGTAISFMNGVPTAYPLSDDAVYYGIVYGASVSGVLDGGSTGEALNVEGNAKVESVRGFKSLNVTGGTLNVAGGQLKSEVGSGNTLVIDGDIVNRRGINAGSIEAEDLTNSGLIGVLRETSDDAGIALTGNLVNSGYIKTSVITVEGNFSNTGKITAVGDITVNGTFSNSGEIYFRSTFSQDGEFAQEGGLALNNVNVTNTGFISAATLTGVKNLTTSKLYVTGGAEISGNITITAGAEVAFTNKADTSVENGLTLGGTITMADNSALIVSGALSSDSQTITINCGNVIGYNEVVRAESGVNAWTIKLAGANAGNYSYVKDDTSVIIYSTDEVFVNAAFEEGSASYNGNTLLFGKNAFATVADAIAGAKAGAKIHVLGDLKGADVAAASFDVVLDGASNIGGLTAKTVTVVGDSDVKSIVAANGLTIKAGAVLTVAETLPTDIPITLDGTAGTGSRLALDVNSMFVTLKDSQVTVKSAAGKTYTAVILSSETAEHAGDLFIVAKDNVFFRKDQTGDTPVAFVDGDAIDGATGDALFLGVNVFGTREAAEAAAQANGGTLYIVGFTTDDGQAASTQVPTVFEFAGGSAEFNGTATPGAAAQVTELGGGSISSAVYGLNSYYEEATGDVTFIADKVNSSTRIYITGNTYGNVMNGNITATITDSRLGGTYIGAGSFGTETKPITIDVTIKDSSISAFHGIETETTADNYNIPTEVANPDPNARQDINADINIKIYDTVIGGTFTVLNTNNCHWNGHGGTLLQTHFTSGAINVEIGGSTLTDNIRVGLALEGGGKAPQAFNVPNTLHIVATDANTVTYASYLCEWDAIIVDATAQLQLNTLQYTTIGIGPQNAGQCTEDLDGFGTLTQVMINMSGYKSGTHAVIVASNRIYTDDALSNITVIGDNDLTGQCELAYIITGGALQSVYVFDKTDDMFVNTNYTDAINGTSDSVTGQEFLFNYNAHTDFDKALSYASEWGGAITVTGGEYEDQDFEGNDVVIRSGVTFGTISMAATSDVKWTESTLTVENGAEIALIDGSKDNIASTLVIESDTEFQHVVDFANVAVDKDVLASFLSLSGSNLSISASSMIMAGELDLTDSSIVIDVNGYVGRPHVVLSSAADIVGFNSENVTIVGENAEKFGLVKVDNSLVLTTTIPSDTFLNSTYTAETTGTILEDGTYLEYGFNAFSDSAAALAGLGGRDNTLTITGGDIAGNLVMNGANFALIGGALEGVVYATYEKDYRNQVISVENGSVGGIEMTAQEGSYRVTRATINLGEAAVVTGALVGAGDTTLNVNGNVSVAQGIENVKNLVVDASGCLTTSSIELVEGGILKIVGSLNLVGTNLHKVVDTEAGYSVAPVSEGNFRVIEQANDIFLLDLSRIYYSDDYTEAISGTTIASGDVLYYGINAFSSLTTARATTFANKGTLFVMDRNGNLDVSGSTIFNLTIQDSTVGTLSHGPTGGQSYTGDVYVVIENSVVANANSYIMGQGAWNSRNTLNGTFTLDVVGSTLGGGRMRLGTFYNSGNKTYVLNFTDSQIRGDMSILEDSPFGASDSITVNMTNVTAPVTKWWTFFDGYPNEDNGTITVNLKDSVLGDGSNGFRFALQRGNGTSNQYRGTVVTFNVDNTTVNGSLQIEKMEGQDITFNGKATLNATGENKIRYVLKFNEVNLLDASASITGSTMTLRSDGVINIDATGYDGPTKAFIYMSSTLSGADTINVTGLDETLYSLIQTENAIVAFDGTIRNIYWNPDYVTKNTGATTAFGDVLIVDGSLEGGAANAFTELEKAKLALPAGYKLIVTGTGEDFDGKLYGTLESQEVTEGDINMLIANGNFTAEDSIIAAADHYNEKVFTGDSTIEIAGGTFGQAPVLDDEGEVVTPAVFAEINGTREVAGGTSGLLVTYSTDNLYANLTDFDYMTVQGTIRVRGDISLVDALFIDCNGSLTVDGELDADSIGSIVLSSEGYEGPSKIVLHSASLTQEAVDAMTITVDNPADRWFYDGDSNLWLVSSDPSNVYVNTAYDDSITGTTSSQGDLLFYGINAVADMEEAIAKTTSDYQLHVTGGVFAGDYDMTNVGAANVYIDGGSIGSLTVGNTEGANLSRIELTGATSKAYIGTLNGDEAGYRLILSKDGKVGTANNVQYIRVGLDQGTGLSGATYIAEGGRFVLDLSEFNGRAGNVLSIAGGLNNFMIPVEGETYSLARVEVTNDATHAYGFYYDEASSNIVSVAMGANAYIRPDANSSLNGTVVDGTTLVYGFNVGSTDAVATYANGGTVFVNDMLAGPIQLRTDNPVKASVIENSIISDVRLGPTSGTYRRTGDFTLDVIGGTFTDGNAYFVGRGSGTGDDQHATFIVGTQEEEGAEIVDGTWNITFRALKDEAGEIVARSRNNNTGNYDFCITQNANIAGGTVNILFEDYYFRGDMRLFDNVWSAEDQDLKELNVRITNGNAPESKWMWIWDPRETNSTAINIYITDTVFTGNDHTFGIFGTDTTGWNGEANVYINGFTMTEGRFSGARGVNTGDVDVGMEGTRALHVVGGTNNISLVKQFTSIEIADGAMLTGNTISLPTGTYSDAGFILRGQAGYTGPVKEYAVVGTTITGGTDADGAFFNIQDKAEFLDADGNVIDGYVAVVGATNVFIYTQDGAVYYNDAYDGSVTGVAIEDAVTGKKNFLALGDNAAATMEDAYAALAIRDKQLLVVEGSSDANLYVNGYKTIVNAGNIGTLYGVAADAGVESVDITLNKGVSVNSVVVATEAAQVTGNALVTVANEASVGNLNGAADFVGGTTKLVFEGDASAFSISAFDDVTIQADSEVTLRNAFDGTSLTINVEGYTGASKRVLTVRGGVVDPEALVIKAGSFTTQWLDEGKTLVLVTDTVTDAFVNTEWTPADVEGKFVGDMLLVWNKNAFNTIAGGAAAVGKDSVLYVQGNITTGDALALSNAGVVLEGSTVALGAVSATSATMTIESKEFTATSLSGISELSVLADAVAISGSIAMTGDGKLTIDVTNHTQDKNDVVVLTTEGGITGLAKDITVVGTDANHYYAYYDETDGDIHMLRIDNLYVDIAFGTAGENIPEGATNVITHEPLVFGANAFYSLTDALSKFSDGMGLYVNGRPYDLRTNDLVADLYLTNSDIPVLINGYTSGDQSFEGDLNINIIDSAVGRSGNSTIVMKTTVDSPWDHLNTVTGNVNVNVTGSTLGSETEARTINGSDYLRVTNGNFTFNVSDSTVYANLEVLGDSPIANSEVVSVNFTNVSAPVDRNWWITDGNQNNAGTINVTLDKVNLGAGNMRVGTQSDWNYGDRNSSNKVTFNVSNTTIGGALTADSVDLDELTGHSGTKVLNITAGDNAISQVLWFKTINVDASATLTADEIRMSSVTSKVVVDATEFSGKSRVVVSATAGIFNLTGNDVSIAVADPETSTYEVLTDYNADAKTMSTIVIKGDLKDIYANEDYTLEDLTIGTSYNGEALFYGFNAFDSATDALAALTVEGADFYVTGALSYESPSETPEVLNINANLINTGNFKLSSKGFVDGSQSDVVVLTATSITGDGVFTTDNAAYTAVVVDNAVHLVLKKVDVFVNTAWAELEDGTIVEIPDGSATIGTDAFATADAAAAKVSTNGSITVLASDVKFTNAIVRTVTATSGSLIQNANIGTANGAGSLTLQGGAAATNAQVRNGTLTVEAGASVSGGLKISEGAVVTFGENTALDLDISASTTESAAVMTGYSIMTGSPAISITIAADQADGTYLVATDAASFNSVVTLKTVAAVISTTLTVGNMETIDGIEYTLAITDNGELTLKKHVYEEPITVTYVNPAWAELEDGAEVTVPGGTAIVGKDAFATGDLATEAVIASGIVKVVAGTVSFASGITKQTQILSGAELTNTNVSSVLTVDAGATLSGKSVFGEGASVTVNGTVVFDLALATEGAQFTGFAVSGDAAYTLVGESAAGDYTLATGVSAFTSLTVGDQTLAVGSSIIVDDAFTYALSLTEGTLALNIASYVPPVVIPTITYVNSAWATKTAGAVIPVEGGTAIYMTDAFSTGDEAIAAVSADGEVKVLGGTVSFTNAIAKTVTIAADATLFGKAAFDVAITIDGTVAFDTALTADGAQITGLSKVTGATKYTLAAAAVAGTYTLATDAAGFNSDVAFNDVVLKVGDAAVTIGDFTYQLAITDNSELALTIAAKPVPPTPTDYVAKFDVDGNGISDVMFVWTGNESYMHGYWMNGTNEWRSTGSYHPADWENLGCYDMTGDGKADSVLVGNAEIEGNKGAYIGYYADAIDALDGSTWCNIDNLNNAAGIKWINKVGNLTGGKANSIVWYAPELFTLGAWTDGTANWVTMTGSFGGDDWSIVGCGDFNGDGKDSVVMSGANGTYFYTADLDGTVTSMGAANWSNWEVRAIGDFSGDGKDDMVLFHKELGSMVMLLDGSLDNFASIGQLDANDWFVVGAGDYNGDKKDDLLVRQYSTGMLGYYTSGDVANGWVELGRGVDMNWTVIA